MTAFSPGQSPPPVSTPIRIGETLAVMSVLAIDAGTTGVTAWVVGADGTVAARGYQEFRQYYPRPGWVEHLPEDIWQAALAACGQALDGAPGPVTALGITNQRETAVVWDRVTLAAPRRAIVWQDRRTARLCDELREAGYEDRISELTGLRLDPYFTGTKLTWLAMEEPATWAGLADRTLTGGTVARPGNGLLSTVAWMDGTGTLTYALEGSVFVTGAAIQWLRDGLGLLDDAAQSEALARTVPDSGGVVFVPALTGLGAPDWDPDARGAVFGITRGTTRAHLVRATLEAIAYEVRDVFDVMVTGDWRANGSLRADRRANAQDPPLPPHGRSPPRPRGPAGVLGDPPPRPSVAPRRRPAGPHRRAPRRRRGGPHRPKVPRRA